MNPIRNRLRTGKLLIIIVLLLAGSYPAGASERFYTIQAGAYAFSKFHYAEAQYEYLKSHLSKDEIDYLRIEKGSRFYFIRIGRFQEIADARKLLPKVQTIIQDAYILSQSPPSEERVVRVFTSPPRDNTSPAKKVEKPQNVEKQQEKTTKSPEIYYTVQIGNFLRLKQARQEYDALARVIDKKHLASLRIERVGKYFSVRVGKFGNYLQAKEFLMKNRDILTGVILMGYLKKEQIVRMYEKPFSSNPGENSRVSVNKALTNLPPAKTELPAEKKEALEALISNVDSYLEKEDYGKAAELLRNGISKWPDNPDLHALYGETLLYMGFPDKAYRQYRKAAELSPDVPEFHAGVGYSLLNSYMDKARASIEAFKKALEIDPDNVVALEGLGIVYVSIDRKDLATEIYYRLKELDFEAAERLDNVIKNGLDWGVQQ